ncbi:MAG TPA: hypothetical protein VGP79_02850 [Bryobacteraceae bacterium]|jgi:septal ring factor EnvC (AmiA/AmiB activator)|nr:hypothetical protein [Bryobacteraceae bacterium]
MSADFEARFERKMDFILDTLASVSTKLDKVTAKNDETADLVKKLAQRQDKTDRQIKAMQLLMKVGMRQMAKTDAKIAELAEQQKRTDRRFEQWLASRNGSNGDKNGGKKRG